MRALVRMCVCMCVGRRWLLHPSALFDRNCMQGSPHRARPTLDWSPDPLCNPRPAGAVGTGRKHVTGTAELRLPLIKPLEGVVFVDGGTGAQRSIAWRQGRGGHV